MSNVNILKKGMAMPVIIIGVLIALAGGYYVYSSQMSAPEAGNDVMTKDDNVEAQNDAMVVDEGDAMMEKEDGDAMKDDDAMMEGDTAMESDDQMVKGAGVYTDYKPELLANAEDGKVVLFFKADWCPSCRSLDKDIESSKDSIPEGVTILKVDYDSSTELKKKYGVTYQHTLVQVDANGDLIKKELGHSDLDEVLSNLE